MGRVASIIISAKDAEATLARSLKSALRSDFSDFEVVLIDDGSVDETYFIAESIQENNKKLRILRNTSTKGLSYSLNKAINSCDSQFVVRLDADDLMMTERVAAQVNLMENNKNLSICGSGAIIIDEFDRPIKVSPPKAFTTSLFWTSLWRVPFFHPSVCFKRSLFDNPEIAYSTNQSDARLEDYQLWSRILQYSNGWNFVKPLICYRKHGRQETQNKVVDRNKRHAEICRKKVAEHTGLKLSFLEAQDQYSLSLGSINFAASMSDLKNAIHIRESCADIMMNTTLHRESAEVGLGIDMLMLARNHHDRKFISWLLASRFRRSCMCKGAKVFPSYLRFQLLRNSWISGLHNT